MIQKIRVVTVNVRRWNKEVFGDIWLEKGGIERRIKELEKSRGLGGNLRSEWSSLIKIRDLVLKEMVSLESDSQSEVDNENGIINSTFLENTNKFRNSFRHSVVTTVFFSHRSWK